MDKDILQDKLDQLRLELADASLDDQKRLQLTALIADIERAVAAEENDRAEPLSDQVEDLVLKFEADHPQLTSALNQVASALANLGI